ncbi:peptidoglycan editing factor PgeF [Mangrovimicrobium sediminis]|uniref:Purine nucleoside phosphorylase n=1 Tax=Mangrovimicrobium sediminis TaxID=2562682 RepID=A0A4Z0LW02_9GAMM|nr:peptidoglycan editing factor PgeF [Haliea sp. SAOS-164]TGD71573.1 peptidoglycan editing factor PgeF [Haliea sp. SAOS-164]
MPEPDWSVPGILALSSERQGGRSAAPWDTFNLGDHVGDDPAAVAANRSRLQAMLPGGTSIQWLQQVHGADVVRAAGRGCPQADACWTDTPGIACAVLTADCLPVLFASADGAVVAAAHAGWRGLLAGVLEATVAAMGVDPGRLQAWMGPAIGPRAFEVGPEVREAFLDAGDSRACFTTSPNPGRYLADIYALARARLAAAGVSAVSGGGECTFRAPRRYFSYRRDGETGRMASLICIKPQ